MFIIATTLYAPLAEASTQATPCVFTSKLYVDSDEDWMCEKWEKLGTLNNAIAAADRYNRLLTSTRKVPFRGTSFKAGIYQLNPHGPEVATFKNRELKKDTDFRIARIGAAYINNSDEDVLDWNETNKLKQRRKRDARREKIKRNCTFQLVVTENGVEKKEDLVASDFDDFMRLSPHMIKMKLSDNIGFKPTDKPKDGQYEKAIKQKLDAELGLSDSESSSSSETTEQADPIQWLNANLSKMSKKGTGFMGSRRSKERFFTFTQEKVLYYENKDDIQNGKADKGWFYRKTIQSFDVKEDKKDNYVINITAQDRDQVDSVRVYEFTLNRGSIRRNDIVTHLGYYSRKVQAGVAGRFARQGLNGGNFF